MQAGTLAFGALTDWTNPNSWANYWRSQRMVLFDRLIEPLPRPVKILDIGGTAAFWHMRGWTDRPDVQIVTINLSAEQKQYANVEPRSGDATSLWNIADKSFDVAFSNSVIEHVGSLEKQAAMASEVQRVASAHWVQTPNYWFPIEPHFHVPGWQWLPKQARIALIQRTACGWNGRCRDPVMAKAVVEDVRLMTRRELARLFPNSVLHAERLGGLVKSWVAYGGFA